MKVSIEDVEAILLEQKVEVKKVQAIISDLQRSAEEQKEEKSSTALPKQKNEYLVVLSDENGELANKELTGWVIQQKVGDDSSLALSKLREAATSYNQGTRKGKKSPLKTFGELFAHISRKFLKEKNILAKSKEPVRVLITSNKL